MTTLGIIKLLLGVLMLSTLLSCREVEHYLYKEIEMPLFDGQLQIQVRTTPKDYDTDNRHLTKYADPYSLGFRFSVHRGKKLGKLSISKITLEGQKTGSVIPLLAREKPYKDYKSYYRDTDLKGIFVIVGYEGETRGWVYEPYILKAKVQVYRGDNQVDEQEIEVLLETDFKKSRRSDKFDAFMSV